MKLKSKVERKKNTPTQVNKKIFCSQKITRRKSQFRSPKQLFSMQMQTLKTAKCASDTFGRKDVQRTYFFIDLKSNKCGNEYAFKVDREIQHNKFLTQNHKQFLSFPLAGLDCRHNLSLRLRNDADKDNLSRY